MSQSYQDNAGPLGTARLHIREQGHHIAMVPPSDYLPSCAYTIGLMESYGHPELICFGMPLEILQVLLNDIAAQLKAGRKLQLYQPEADIFEYCAATFLPVDERNLGDYFGLALDHYEGKPLSAWQMVWPDANEHFPWEEGFDEQYSNLQPLLDRNAEFKFLEQSNLGIYTSRQWLEEGKPILMVLHDEEGDWQFLTGEEEDEDIRIVALASIVKSDLSLNAVFDLEYNECAERESVDALWKRREWKGEE